LTIVLFLFATGCGGTEAAPTTPEATTEATDTTPTGTEPAETSRCLSVGKSLKNAIGEGLTVEGGGKLGKAAAVRSEDFEKVWYVSAVIRGPGMDADTVGTWASNIEPGTKDAGGLIMAADSIAREFSVWGEAAEEGSPAAEVRGLENDGAQESRDCL
jgi:hypothetical protein